MPPKSIDRSLGPALHGLTSDVCRHCGRSSKRCHPGGVVAGGNWRCGEPDCQRWQIRERWGTGDGPIEEDAREATA